MAYIGREPLGGEVILLNSIESQFNGVLTTFNLTRTVSGATSAFYPIGSEQLLVSLGGVIQRPDPTGDTGFRIAFNTIIFAVAPVAGASCFIISYGNITDIGSPANNTVTTEKLVDGAVTPAKLSTGGPWWLSSGNVGIGTTNPQYQLELVRYGTTDIVLKNTRNTNGGPSTGSFSCIDQYVEFGSVTNHPLYLKTSNNTRLSIDTSGNVGIGTTNPGFRLEVNGSFAATTKSFLIPHPTKENYKLRHGSLEGPENGVYVRGRTSTNIIELPDYWTGLVDEDSITVNLTPIGNRHIWVEEINNNKVYINSEDTIDCFYTVFAERKDVEKLIVEIEEN